ncbi:MAG: 6-pyruvoyl-tetrahydropterin synthase-related protein [Caldilineaceae bacterium]
MTDFARNRLQRFWPLLLFVLTIPSTIFLFLYGLPMTHDGATHLLRIARLDEYLRQGVLFTRWFPDLLLGYGYPVLNYYAAGAYYLVESLHLLGLNLYYAFIVAQVALVYLAAVGMYLFARDFFGAKHLLPALVTSMAYIYAPYLLINIYVRGAIAELGAQMLLPWILWSFRRIWLAPKPRPYVLPAILSLGALAWTHTISLLIIPPLLIAYMLLLRSLCTEPWSRSGWSAFAITAAMGVTCFYWLPLIFERAYITDVGFAITKQFMLPLSFIDWHYFLDTGLRYSFPEDPPFRFGLVQVLGMLVGLLFIGRKPREIWFWVGIMLLCLLMMTDLTRPIWFSNDLLPIIQFPWRLQAIWQFPIALLWGLPLMALRSNWLRLASTALVIALLMYVYFPHLPWAYLLSSESNFGMALNASFEAQRISIIKRGHIVSSVQEFRPKGVAPTLALDPKNVAESPVLLNSQDTLTTTATVNLVAANPFALRLQVAGNTPFPLRLASYYFPGWVATLDQSTSLAPYPTTNLGLLTVDVPAGAHTLTIAWQGTKIAVVGGLISQLALLLVALWQLRQRMATRGWGSLPLLLLGLGLFGTYVQPSPRPVHPGVAVDLPGLEFMGYHNPTVTGDGILVQLYWLATQTQPSPLSIRWQLRAADQRVVAETVAAPFYDSYATEHWATNTVVDDAYLIPVPLQAAPGLYTLVMAPLDPHTGKATTEIVVGAVTLPQPPAAAAPQNATSVYFNDLIVLRGYDVHVVERLWQPDRYLAHHPDILVVPAGETLHYTLHWQTEAETNEPYVAFMHLTDHLGQTLVHHDHLPGPIFIPPAIWATYNQYRDKFLLEIPPNAESGLYWPNLGMYNWKDFQRVPVRAPGLAGEGDHINLAPVKVVNSAIRTQGTATHINFGDLAELVSFSSEGGVRGAQHDEIIVNAGESFTLTTYYEAKTTSEQELTRFIQLRDAADHMLTQFDSEPQNGLNPTWAWLPGEIVRDQVVLQIPQDAAAGHYTLYLGFYDAAGNFARLPVRDRNGTDLANQEYPLIELTVRQKAGD